MNETKSIMINLRITPTEEKELTERFGSPGKALRHSVDAIMADRKIRVPDPQFLIFPNAMVAVDEIASAQPLAGGLLNPGQEFFPKVRILLNAGTYMDVDSTYDDFLKELAKARLAK